MLSPKDASTLNSNRILSLDITFFSMSYRVESNLAAEIGLVGELPRAANLCAKSIAQDELMLVVASDHSFVEGSRRTSGKLPRISNGTN